MDGHIVEVDNIDDRSVWLTPCWWVTYDKARGWHCQKADVTSLKFENEAVGPFLMEAEAEKKAKELEEAEAVW